MAEELESPSTHLLVPYCATRVRKPKVKRKRDFSQERKSRAAKICVFCHRPMQYEPVSAMPEYSYTHNFRPTAASTAKLCHRCSKAARQKGSAYCRECERQNRLNRAAGISRIPRRDENGLTPAQRAVLSLMFVLPTSADVAKKLGITVRTVSDHRFAILSKIKARNQFQLAVWAERMGYGRELPK